MQKLVFGINGGGTFSRMRVEKNSTYLDTFNSKGTNLFVEPLNSVTENLFSLFDQAYKKYNIRIQDYSSGCIGSAGIDRSRKENITTMQSILKNIGFNQRQIKNIDICSDGEILLVGAFNDTKALGSILISGTGSIAITQIQNNVQKNEIHRFGGFGHLLGDEGSAYWIAIKIFSTALQEHETKKYSLITHKLMTYIKEKTAEKYKNFFDIIPYVHSLSGKTEISQHAQLLSHELIKQCPIAKKIACDAAYQLYLLFMRVFNAYPHSAKQLILDGSVFVKNDYIREQFRKLCPEDVHISLIHEKESAEIGACLLAESSPG